MSICRVEKVKNYTVMSNYHLDDQNLSLKAVGLLSKMLRLPDNWDFTIVGLNSICKDGPSSISATLKELEEAHYIKRERTRNEKGVIDGIVYHIYEVPYDMDKTQRTNPEFVGHASMPAPSTEKPSTENPNMENPEMDNPQVENPHMENPSQSNTNIPITNEPNTNTPSTNQSIYQNIKKKNNSADESVIEANANMNDRLMEMKSRINYHSFEAENDLLLEQLENDTLSLDEFNSRSNHMKLINLLLSDVCEIYASSDEEVNIGKRTVSRKAFLAKFETLTHADIKKITNLVYAHNPKNRKLYTLAVIFNY